MRRFWIGILLLIILSVPIMVRAGDEASWESWSDITTFYDLSDDWRYHGDQGIRLGLDGNDFTLFYFRPSVRYRFKRGLTLHGGVGFFQSFLEDDTDLFELRPWQGLRFVWPRIGGYIFSHLLRLEERFTRLTGERSDSDFTLRSRYQLGVRTPSYNILFDKGIFFRGSIEGFWNIESSFSENFKDRLRYVVGAGTQFSNAWRVELQYVQQDGRAIRQDSFSTDERIIRLRLFYNMN